MSDRELLEMALKTLAVYMELPNDHWPGPPTTAYAALRTALSRKALDELAEIDSELGLDYMQPDLARVGEVGVWGEQEPVAYRYKMSVEDDHWVWNYCTFIDKANDLRAEPLYTHPQREWQGLTEEQRSKAIASVPANNIGGEYYYEEVEQVAKIIEAQLKEQNT